MKFYKVIVIIIVVVVAGDGLVAFIAYVNSIYCYSCTLSKD